jgi:hypothetical protein
MTIAFYQVQIIVIECPFTQACRLRSPLEDILTRLRQEILYGRNDPADSPATSTDLSADFHDTFRRN